MSEDEQKRSQLGLSSCISPHPRGCMLQVLLCPRSSRRGIQGLLADRVKIAVPSPPVDGAANDALLLALAELFDYKKGKISIVHGATSRRKTVLFEGLSVSRLHELVIQFLE